VPSQYASEVWKVAQRDNLHPERTAAEHLNLTPWSKIEGTAKIAANRALASPFRPDAAYRAKRSPFCTFSARTRACSRYENPLDR
jgi:hypothetical protein